MDKQNIFWVITKTIAKLLTALASVCYLFSCSIPFLSPARFWWLGFLGLAFPYLFTLLVALVFFWVFTIPKRALFPSIVVLLGYQQISVLFAYHIRHNFQETKDQDCIRVLHWNLRGFNGLTQNKYSKQLIREDIQGSVLKLNPDIICFQEFNHSYSVPKHINPLADNIGLFKKEYPYFFFSKDTNESDIYVNGNIIFSKYPILDSGKTKFLTEGSIIYVDVLKGKDTIRIYTTHLKSFTFKDNDYDNISKVEEIKKGAFSASKSVFHKMMPAFKQRAAQSDKVKELLGKSPYPSIITGDFNDVPNSYTYFTIRGKRQDAFLEKYFGLGKSFVELAPTLRIDYILPDNNFTVQQFEMIDEGLSDHYMLVSDLELKKHQ